MIIGCAGVMSQLFTTRPWPALFALSLMVAAIGGLLIGDHIERKEARGVHHRQ